MSEDQEIVEDVFELIMREASASWDIGPLEFSRKLRELLDAVKDDGTAIDSGGGDGSANLWVTSGGVEFFITVERSQKHIRAKSH